MELSALLYASFLGQPAGLWLSFFALLAVLLAFDLGVLHRMQREIPVSERLRLSAGYINTGWPRDAGSGATLSRIPLPTTSLTSRGRSRCRWTTSS